MKLPEKCKGRELARDLLSPYAQEEEVTLSCKSVKTMGQGFCKEVVTCLLVEGRTKALVMKEPPAHAVLYLREAAYRAGVGKKLLLLPRG